MRLVPAWVPLVVLLLSACSGGPDPAESLTGDRETALLMRREHELSWRDREETGDPAEVEILLDALVVGKGEEGMAELRRLVRSMAKETRIRVLPPPGEGPVPPCPFDRGLVDYGRRYGVVLELPGPG